jgi:hypothetical protein
MAEGYKEFEPHQYADHADLDRRAREIDLRAVVSDEDYATLIANAGRICLGEDFLRQEALVYMELPEDHRARRFTLPEYIEERMCDKMYGEFPRSAI